MELETILTTRHLDVLITVKTSKDFTRQVNGKVDLGLLARDIKDALGDEIESWGNLSPDKSRRRLESVELFLCHYLTPDLPLVDEIVDERLNITVATPKPIEGEGKFGWHNVLGISGSMGYYEFLIMNGYYEHA